mmetsp:Transcript_3637/g.13427  ORF Transcript_3637/g.13427 Transcript_3637/m.13427 type:complete len:207 (-) Transcript_3637:219-839(-)
MPRSEHFAEELHHPQVWLANTGFAWHCCGSPAGRTCRARSSRIFRRDVYRRGSDGWLALFNMLRTPSVNSITSIVPLAVMSKNVRNAFCSSGDGTSPSTLVISDGSSPRSINALPSTWISFANLGAVRSKHISWNASTNLPSPKPTSLSSRCAFAVPNTSASPSIVRPKKAMRWCVERSSGSPSTQPAREELNLIDSFPPIHLLTR